MTQRRVLVITTAFPPSTCAGIHRIVRFVRHLPEQGWEPCVLSEGTEDGLCGELAATFELPHDLVVRRTRALGRSYGASACGVSGSGTSGSGTSGSGTSGSGTSDGESRSNPSSQKSLSPAAAKRDAGVLRTFARNLRDLSLATPDKDIAWSVASVREAIAMVRRLRPDVVVTSGPPHSTHLIGLAVKRMTRTPWLADFRDPWARRPWGFKAQNPWGQRLLGRFERTCVRHADRVILNTEPMAAEFRSFYGDRDPSMFVTIPNACDPRLTEQVGQLGRGANGTDPLDSEKPVRLCHPGSLYRKRDPRPLLKAIADLRRSGTRIEFEQIGACDPGFALESFVAEQGLAEAVTIDSAVPHAECLSRMARADLFVLLQPGTAIQVPGKLFEMMSFGKPILALADEGASAELIRSHDIGVVARPDDAKEIATAIRSAIARFSELSDSQKWDEVREVFDVRRTVESLAGELANVTDPAAPKRSPVVQESAYA